MNEVNLHKHNILLTWPTKLILLLRLGNTCLWLTCLPFYSVGHLIFRNVITMTLVLFLGRRISDRPTLCI